MIRNILMLVAVAVLALPFTACGGSDPQLTESENAYQQVRAAYLSTATEASVDEQAPQDRTVSHSKARVVKFSSMGPYASEEWLELSDGRVVFCISTYRTLSCDWENARIPSASE